ncbi:MAG: hypothetical protein IIA10_10600 [Proteobacteria bacterium]|nr:hypothetical protein [Pseudomonadota bacterium]
MTEKTGFTLSHGTVRAVTELLVNSENLEDKQAALAAKDVERACRLALSIDIPDSPSAVKGELEVLYQLIDARYGDERFTVVTTNQPLEEIRQMWDGRIYSRLTEMCRIVDLRGSDYREHLNPWG